jgi:hypothetical protein
MEHTLKIKFPVTFSIMVVTLLSTLFFAGIDQAYATPVKKKTTETARTTFVERTETRIKQLKGVLKITEAQQEPWNTLTDVMRENAKEMETLAKVRTESTQIINAVENMKFYYQVSKTHLDQQAKFIPPFEALYTSMSDEQKQSADLVFRTGKFGRNKTR